MSQAIPTQFIATRLITDILTHNEAGIKGFIAPNIRVTSVVNGTAPVVSEGEAAYLARIHLIWENVINYHYTAFLYDNFTEGEGALHFTQVITGKGTDENEVLLSEGTQEFTFTDGQITAISINETMKALSKAEYESTLAKVKEQKVKIMDSMEPTTSSFQRDCVIL